MDPIVNVLPEPRHYNLRNRNSLYRLGTQRPVVHRLRPAPQPRPPPPPQPVVVNDRIGDIYYNPRSPGSFGSIESLFRQVQALGLEDITRADLSDWLSAQPTYTLHKQVPINFEHNRIVVNGVDGQWQCDLCDVSRFAKYNNGVTFLLVIIDVFSKKVWVVALKNKNAETVADGFESVIKESGRKPEKLQSDRGREFDNPVFKKLMSKYDIHHFYAWDPVIKASVVERVNRTLKGKVWKYQTYKRSYRYIDALPDIVHAYNNSFHRSIKMTPEEASRPENTKQVWKNLYGNTNVSHPPLRNKFKYQIGDYVRISKERGAFTKGYTQGWTQEVFVIDKRSPRDPVVYKLRDSSGEPIIGSFYEQELQKVTRPPDWDQYQSVKQGPSLEYFVTAKNYPAYNRQNGQV